MAVFRPKTCAKTTKNGSCQTRSLTILEGVPLPKRSSIGQGWIIHQDVKGAVRWTLATVLGCGIDWLVLLYTTGILSGIGTGLCQWLVLRRRVRNASWWILANIASWVIVWHLGSDVTSALIGNQSGQVVYGTVYFGITGTMHGAIMGSALVLLLAHQALFPPPTNISKRRRREIEAGTEEDTVQIGTDRQDEHCYHQRSDKR